MIEEGFILKNPNGNFISFFKDKGMAVIFCHQHNYPEKWISFGSIEVLPK